MKIRREFTSDSDHEQWERDYYDRKSSGGIVTGIIILVLLVVVLIGVIWDLFL